MAIANTQVKQANRPQVSLTGRKTISPFSIFHFPTALAFFLWVLCTKFSTNRYSFAVYKTFPMAACCSCCFFLGFLFAKDLSPSPSLYICLSLSLTPVCRAYSCFPLFCLHLNWKLVFGHFNMARLLIYHATFPFLFCFFFGFSLLPPSAFPFWLWLSVCLGRSAATFWSFL